MTCERDSDCVAPGVPGALAGSPQSLPVTNVCFHETFSVFGTSYSMGKTCQPSSKRSKMAAADAPSMLSPSRASPPPAFEAGRDDEAMVTQQRARHRSLEVVVPPPRNHKHRSVKATASAAATSNVSAEKNATRGTANATKQANATQHAATTAAVKAPLKRGPQLKPTISTSTTVTRQSPKTKNETASVANATMLEDDEFVATELRQLLHEAKAEQGARRSTRSWGW